jgi:hypothetical protein
MKLIETQILKSRSGIYQDTSENRRLHRVGQKYGEGKKEDEEENKKEPADPAKELEAVNKVIEAINNKKMTLPPDQIMALIEKKNKLELAKRQAEKINEGVKANEEKRNVEEVKETNKKINEASKENKAEKSVSKKYDKMSIEEAKKELLGKELSIADNETGKTRIEKITSIVEGNVRGHSTVMARVEGGGTYPIKHIGTGKEWKAWKLDIVSENGKKEPESKNEPEKNEKPETEKETDKETYTRVKFDDLPNSGKVNLKKYLSDKVKKTADQNLGVLSKVSTDNLKKMEAGLVSEFNSQFDDLPKSRRAEKLYSIMKVKNELAKRGTEAK